MIRFYKALALVVFCSTLGNHAQAVTRQDLKDIQEDLIHKVDDPTAVATLALDRQAIELCTKNINSKQCADAYNDAAAAHNAHMQTSAAGAKTHPTKQGENISKDEYSFAGKKDLQVREGVIIDDEDLDDQSIDDKENEEDDVWEDDSLQDRDD